MNPRRTIGRRKTDRFRFAAGMGFALCLAGAILQLSRCNTGTVTGPEKTPEVSTPSSQPAATTPTTPTPVADPTTTPDHECSVGKNGFFSITNKSSILQQYAAWWTDFDDQDTVRGTHGPFQFQPGDSMIGSFNRQCIQVDVGQTINGTPFCFGFIDKEGNTFVPSRAPDKVAACRTKPCVEKWVVDEEPEVGEWADSDPPGEGDIVLNPNAAFECFKWQRRLAVIYEENSCDKSRRALRRFYQYQKVETDCECEESNPNNTKTYSPVEWSGQDPIQGACEYPAPNGVVSATVALCHENGTQAWTIDYSCSEDSTGSDKVCKPVDCPCVEQWILGPEVVVNDGEPSACEVARPNDPFACSQKQKTLKERFETNTCTQDVRPAPGYPKKGITQITGCECPEALICYYNNQGDDGKEQCMAQPGFVSWNDGNHLCALTFPGISSDDFQLNPGQSEKGCLNKNTPPPAVQ